MQVKKFEARSMKEALEMVKKQLGPDAIILSAKDNGRSFGLGGHGSVEITAAVSEDTLHKKKFVESRMRIEDRDKIQKAPARVQRQFIDNMVNKYVEEKKPRPEITRTPYIDIDDGMAAANHSPDTVAPVAGVRVRSAAQEALNALKAHGDWTEASEVSSLREEVAQLKSVLSKFQNIPQTMSGSTSTGQHPGADFGLQYELSAVFEKLLRAGVAAEIAAEILLAAQKQLPPIKLKNKSLIDGWVARHILESTKVVGDTQGTKVQIFMGPSGSGKTSTLVKLASHYVVNPQKSQKKVALLTADTHKVGAADQLRIYAQILNVPFAIVRTSQDWTHIMSQLKGYDYILCDFPGSSLKTLEESQVLKNLLPLDKTQITNHLVLSSTSKDQDLSEMGRRYNSLDFDDVIFTSLDDSAQQGSVYNFMKRFNAPLHSFGIGPRVPEDFEVATKERVLDLIFKLTNVQK